MENFSLFLVFSFVLFPKIIKVLPMNLRENKKIINCSIFLFLKFFRGRRIFLKFFTDQFQTDLCFFIRIMFLRVWIFFLQIS